MRKLLLASCFGVTALFTAGYATANDELAKLSADPNQWVMPAGNFAATRYSELKQINTENVHKLAPAWTFSTGVLRGHEGAPLVIGDVMFLHAPFPNTVFALDLNNDGKIIWKYEPKQDPNVIPVMCCDTVNRGLAYADGKIFLHQADTTLVALDAKTGAVVWSVKDGDASKGQTGTDAPFVFKDKVFVGVSGGEFGVRGWMSAYDMKTGKLVWRGYSEGPDSDTLIDPEKTTSLGKPVGKDFEHQHVARRSMEDRRRHDLGLVCLRSRSQSDVLWLGQSLDLESETAARRQQVVDDHLGARRRHRRGQVGLSDDAPRRVGL